MDAFFSYFQGDSPFLQSIGEWSYLIYTQQELIQMYIHLILAAVFPIYIGAHASLRRPPSAAVPKKKAPGEDGDDEDDNKKFDESKTRPAGLLGHTGLRNHRRRSTF